MFHLPHVYHWNRRRGNLSKANSKKQSRHAGSRGKFTIWVWRQAAVSKIHKGGTSGLFHSKRGMCLRYEAKSWDELEWLRWVFKYASLWKKESLNFPAQLLRANLTAWFFPDGLPSLQDRGCADEPLFAIAEEEPITLSFVHIVEDAPIGAVCEADTHTGSEETPGGIFSDEEEHEF